VNDLAAAYAVLLHDPQLRQALVMEHERPVSPRAQSRIRRRLMVWLAGGLHGLAARLEPSVSSSADTHPQPGIAIEALISTKSVFAPLHTEGG
jgi:hypothetical protein